MMIKKRILWEPEEKLFYPLCMVYGNKRVFSKVRMIDVISDAEPNLTAEERSYLFKAHFDFVVTNDSFTPLLAFELDGKQHLIDKKQIDRDKKKESICKKVGFCIARIPIDQIRNAEEEAAYLRNIGKDKITSTEIIADMLFGNHEASVNPEFLEFMEWIKDKEFYYPIVITYNFRGLVLLVREKGLDGAKERIEWDVSLVNQLDELFKKSGYSEEEWKNIGFNSAIAFTDICSKKQKELNVSDEEFMNSRIGTLMLIAFSIIVKRTANKSTIYDNYSLVRELVNTRLQYFSSLREILSNHPDVFTDFVEFLGFEADPVKSIDDVEKEIKGWETVNEYLIEISKRPKLK